jgi:hypothetical protein
VGISGSTEKAVGDCDRDNVVGGDCDRAPNGELMEFLRDNVNGVRSSMEFLRDIVNGVRSSREFAIRTVASLHLTNASRSIGGPAPWLIPPCQQSVEARQQEHHQSEQQAIMMPRRLLFETLATEEQQSRAVDRKKIADEFS